MSQRTLKTAAGLAVLMVLLLSGTHVSRAESPDRLQDLAVTMERLKDSIEAVSVTLVPVDIEGGDQYYSRYSFEFKGCAVALSYDFTFFDRRTRLRKTVRLPFFFNLKKIDLPELAPFYLTHISNQVYVVEGKGFRIPVASTDKGERIRVDLERARRICRGMD